MKHTSTNPIGKYPDTEICKSIGHDWDNMEVEGREFRGCKRCDRFERKEYFGIGDMWVVNEIKPAIA